MNNAAVWNVIVDRPTPALFYFARDRKHCADSGGRLVGMLLDGWGGAGYGSSKAAVIRLTKFAPVSYAARGVRVNCFAPGVTPTRASYKFGDDYAKVLVDEQIVNRPIRRAIETFRAGGRHHVALLRRGRDGDGACPADRRGLGAQYS